MTGPDALADLGARYPDTLVGLERFAHLLRQPSAALRVRRTAPGRFPSGVGSQPRSRFLLGELVEWSTASGITDDADVRRISRFALECAVRRCAVVHGSEATNRFVGGVATIVAAGWRPTTDDERALVRRLRTDPVPPWHAPLPPLLELRGFVPDPHPALDPRVRAATIEWRRDDGDQHPTFAIPDDAPEGVDVVRETLATWDTRRDLADFAGLVDDFVLQLLRSRERRSSTSPRLMATTMAALAPVGPGALVCDPATGEASTLIELVERTRAAGTQTIGVTGREILEWAWTIAKIRLGVRSIAHRLGPPGADSLVAGAFDETFDVVVCEPAVRKRNHREWFDLCRSLVGENGTAVLAVPAEILGSGFPLGSWWESTIRSVRTIVLTPRDRRRTRAEPWAVCALGPHHVEHLDVVIATESTGPEWVRDESRRMARLDEWRWIGNRHVLAPMNPPQIAAITAIGSGATIGSVTTGRDIGLEIVTVEAAPWPVAELVDAHLGPRPPRRPSRLSTRPESSGRASGEPSMSMLAAPVYDMAAGASADPAAAPTRAEALADVLRLRWLLDPDPELDLLVGDGPAPGDEPRMDDQRRRVREVLGGDPRELLELDPDRRGAIADEATDEVRRALKRLGQRLSGFETRGRRG